MSIIFGSLWSDVILVLTVVMMAVVGYFNYSYTYWKRRGVPYLEPSFPYGNYMYNISKAPTLAGETCVWYNKLKSKGLKFGGVWMFSRPVLVLVDPDYIRDILTKDFNNFIDRDIYVNEKSDPRGTHLFNISSSGWKPLRQKLTPTFTSGKMKNMFNNVLLCSNNMTEYMKKCSAAKEDIDIREVCSSFTSDVIFSVAFGAESNSFSDKDTEIRRQGKEMFIFDIRQFFKILMIKISPSLSRMLGLKLLKEVTTNFFADVVKDAMEYRKKSNDKRNDFLQLLIDINENANHSQEKPFTFDEIVANTVLFFLAGFDTSSSAMSFALYELAKNPEIQEKTREEINTVLQKYNGNITYEAIKNMTYLQQVVDETLRIWPPLISLARICTKDYKLRDTDIIIEKGTAVGISPLALGRDPDYFPNPEKFDPDRFSAENKAKLHPYVHIPFGEGPRNCIGLRFGIMQSKIGLVRVLTNFRLSISPTTQLPITVEPRKFLLKSKETVYLRAEKI